MSDANAPTDDQRTLRILLAVLAGIVVLGALWFLVISPLVLGDEASDTAPDQPTTAQPAPTETVSPESGEPGIAQLPVETYEIFLSRDPFDPVVPAAVGDGAADADGDGQPDVVIIDRDGDGVPDGDDGTDGDGVPDGDDDEGLPQHDAVLIDVFVDDSGEPRALIRVGDRIFTVGEGDIFADDYSVVAIDGTCVTLAFQGSTFTLCEGGGGTGEPDAPGGNGNGDGTADGRCSTRDGQVVCEGRVVTLIDVFVSGGQPVAVVQVDSTLYEVRQGDDFAGNFRVISIDPPCATFLFGDDAFTLCEGQRTLK